MQGDALATAGFAFNAACFLALLALIALVARRMAPEAAPLAVLLCALSGQTVYTALGQSDMGLFMLLSMAALAAALYHRYVLLGLALFLASWCRPEGMILSFVIIGAALTKIGKDSPSRRGLIAAGAAGLAAFAMVLLLNFVLTGTTTFYSVISKGLLRLYPIASVLYLAGEALGSMTRGILFGISGGGRQFYSLPVLGGLLGLIGLLSRDWKKGETARVELWWGLSALAAIAMVSISDWVGTAFDRYIAWFFPIWLIYIAIGTRALSDRLPWPGAFPVLAALLALYQCAGTVFFASDYARACSITMSNVKFARRADANLPEGSRIGVEGYSGLAYYLPHHTVLNIQGFVSADFASPERPVTNLEILKHQPETRFDAWLLRAPGSARGWIAEFVGDQVAAQMPALGGSTALVLHRANWETLEGATQPQDPGALESIQDMELVDSLDVGYLQDEERVDYSFFIRVPGARFHPFAVTRKTGELTLSEVGRLIIGSETFRIRATPGKPMRIVMRTAADAEVPIHKPGLRIQIQDFSFTSPITLRLFVDGRLASEVSVDLTTEPDEFSEVVLDLPAEAVTSDPIEITIGGDRISFAYWFYQ